MKITVIATGFDRKAVRGATSTPVDLSAYTQHRHEQVASAAAAQQPAAAAGGGGHSSGQAQYSAPPLTVNRRAPLDLSLAAVASAGGGQGGRTETASVDFNSPLDVPAFLRRQS